jgi:hypothetical protein
MTEVVFEEQFDTGFQTTLWKPLAATYGQPTRHQTYRSNQIIIDTAVDADDGNVCILRAERKSPEPADAYKWWSGGFDSGGAGRFYPCFGSYVMRGKLSHGQGLWPAFWLTHRNGGSTAEIDIMEYFHAAEPGETRATVWLDYDAGSGYSLKRGSGTGGFETPTLTPGEHTWRVDIELTGGTLAAPTEVTFTFFIDDVQIWQWVEATRLDWLVDHLDHVDDMWNIKVNLQVDGQWVGNPDGTLGYYDQVNRCSNNNSAPPGGDPTACTLPTHIRRVGYNDVGAGTLPSLRTGQTGNFATGNADFTIDYIRVFAEPPDVPTAPVVAATDVASTAITLSWPTPTTGGSPITGYTVFKGVHGDPLVAIEVIGPTNTYEFNGLLPNTSYDLAVQATNAVGESPQSNVVTASTLAADLDPPDAPAPVIGEVTALTVRVDWATPAGDAITGYNIYQATSGDTLALVATIGPANGYSFTGLDPSTAYDFAVETINAAGVARSTTVTATTLAGSFVPTRPTITLVSPAATTATVHWSPSLPNGDAITGYNIYGGPHGGALTLLDTVDPDVFEYEATVGTVGTTWDFQVSAVNGVGESALSPIVSATTTTSPSTPTLTVVGATTTSVTVRWVPPASGGVPISNYRFYVAPTGGTPTLDGTVASGVDQYTFGGLTPGTVYDFAIDATGANGSSPMSSVVSYSTLAVLDPGTVGDATFVPFPGMPTPPPRYVLSRVWDETMSTHIVDLPMAYGTHVEASENDVGGGNLTIQKDQPGATELVGGRIIQTQQWNADTQAYVNSFLWRLEDTPKVTIAPTTGERVLTPAGRGVAQDFEAVQVDPHYGAGHIPWGDIRNFGWQAPELLDNGTGLWPWGTPNVRLSLGNTTAHPPYGLFGKPYGNPNPLAPWLWGQAPVNGADPKGFCYFRYRFTLTRAVDVTFYVTADDLFVAALDGVDIVDFQTDGTGNAAGVTYWRKFHLGVGDHVFAARVENLASPGITENCGLFNMCATYGTSPHVTSPWHTTDTQEMLFSTAGWAADSSILWADPGVGHGHIQGWRSLAYPDLAPGMSPGSILLILLTEAKARGELLGWTVTFSDTQDSAGTTWPEFVPEYNCRVGTTYAEVLKQLVDQGFIHWEVSPDALVLNVYAANHDFGAPAGATFTEGENIRQLTHGDKWGLARDKALARTDDGYVRRGAGPRQMYLSIPDWTDAAKINSYLDQQIARTHDDSTNVALSFLPLTAATTPLVGFRPLQSITIPNPSGTPYTPRVTQCTIDENQVGPPNVTVQLESLVQSANKRISEVQDRTAPGAFNGRAASIAPYSKSQPQGGELKLIPVGYSLGARADNAATNAISDGLTYADSADKRPTGRWRLTSVELTASELQVDEAPYTGFSVVQVLYNGVVGMTLGLGPGQRVINDFLGTSYVDPRFAYIDPFPNWFLETGPTDSIRVQLVAAGTHRNLLLTLYGYEIP